MVPLNLALLRRALSSQGRFWWDLMGLLCSPLRGQRFVDEFGWSSREATQPSHDHHRREGNYSYAIEQPARQQFFSRKNAGCVNKIGFFTFVNHFKVDFHILGHAAERLTIKSRL